MTERVDWAAMLAWLSECVDTDERKAQVATAGPWEARYYGVDTEVWAPGAHHVVLHGGMSSSETRQSAEHIARHDPERALAEVEAMRAMLADWQRTRDKWAALYDRPAAELHRDRMHPDYEYATTEGQRKAWDDVNVPPDGDGWERNVDAGIPGEGWERFDYTEESYWRRLLPEDQRGGREPKPPQHIRHMVTAYRHEPGYRPEWAPEADHG